MAYSPRYENDERTPLLVDYSERQRGRPEVTGDPHKQFCMLIGIPSSDKAQTRRDVEGANAGVTRGNLYSRALKKRRSQSTTYAFTAALSNSLLLSQIVLGATLTALGASESSHILITVFGVLNTVIAGAIAFIKSRGQPMRARSFRDDLEHVVDEIENSEIMWLGITKDIHGYDEIDIDDRVSVRSEVARLTRLYESAVKKNAQNNPDMYSAGGVLDAITGLRARPTGSATAALQLPPVAAATDAGAAAAPAADAAGAAAGAVDADEAPATSKDTGKKNNGKDKETPPAAEASSSGQAGSSEATPAPPKEPAVIAQSKGDPDDEPASAAHPSAKASDADQSGPNGTK